MARDEGGAVRSQKTTDIYSVMLILSMVFLLGAIALTYHELSTHYDFWGAAGARAADTESGGAGDAGTVETGAGSGEQKPETKE